MQFTTAPPVSIRTPYTHAPPRRVWSLTPLLTPSFRPNDGASSPSLGRLRAARRHRLRCHTFPGPRRIAAPLPAQPPAAPSLLFAPSLHLVRRDSPLSEAPVFSSASRGPSSAFGSHHLQRPLFFSHPVSIWCVGTRLSLRHPLSPPLPAALSRRLAVTTSNDRLRHPALVPARRYEARPLSRAASPPSASRGPFSALAATASGDRLRHSALAPARRSEARLLSRAASSLPARGASLFHIWMDGNSFIRARGASRPHGFGSLATSYGCRLRTMPTYLPWSPLWAS